MTAKIYALALFAAGVTAQSLSSGCQAAIAGIAGNPTAAECLSPGSLIPLFIDGNSSIIPPINSFLTSLCAAPACSNATIAAIYQNVTAGCSLELSATGYSDANKGAYLEVIQTYYPTVRKVLCLKEGNTNCITQSLNTVEGILGPLSLNNIVSIATAGIPTDTSTGALNNLTCTNCVKEAYNILKKDLPDYFNSGSDESLSAQCGAAFIDGASPSGISQSASTASASTSSPSNAAVAMGAISMSHAGFGGVAVSAVVAMVSVLAVFV